MVKIHLFLQAYTFYYDNFSFKNVYTYLLTYERNQITHNRVWFAFD